MGGERLARVTRWAQAGRALVVCCVFAALGSSAREASAAFVDEARPAEVVADMLAGPRLLTSGPRSPDPSARDQATGGCGQVPTSGLGASSVTALADISSSISLTLPPLGRVVLTTWLDPVLPEPTGILRPPRCETMA